MPIILHGPDNHAPFEHELVITPTQMVMVKRQLQIVGGHEFIICSICNHWVDRPMPEKCRCRASCHAEARSVYAFTEM